MVAFHAQPFSSQCENEDTHLPSASPWKLVAISTSAEESCFHGMVLGQFVRVNALTAVLPMMDFVRGTYYWGIL